MGFTSLSKLLHGPPMLVEKTNFGLVLYNYANFYPFEETSSYWLVKEYQFFSAFHWATSDTSITVYNRTVTTIENTVQAVHSCNSWFSFYSLLLFFSMCRALDKRKVLMIIRDNFNQFCIKSYNVTPNLNRLVETVQMRGHNIWLQ